jgi:hypothetical protein
MDAEGSMRLVRFALDRAAKEGNDFRKAELYQSFAIINLTLALRSYEHESLASVERFVLVR